MLHFNHNITVLANSVYIAGYDEPETFNARAKAEEFALEMVWVIDELIESKIACFHIDDDHNMFFMVQGYLEKEGIDWAETSDTGSDLKIILKGYSAKYDRAYFQEAALPTLEQLHDFIKTHYKHERFMGRNNPNPKDIWHTYSTDVARSALERLVKLGFSGIGRHEAKDGEGFWYTFKNGAFVTGTYQEICKGRKSAY